MTIYGPTWKVRDWVLAGILKDTDPDEVLVRLMDEHEIKDEGYRREMLRALYMRRFEATTGMPF